MEFQLSDSDLDDTSSSDGEVDHFRALQSYTETDARDWRLMYPEWMGSFGRVVDEETERKTGEGSRKVTIPEGFPEELVEKILSRVPFPSVFKARVLSKSWFFKLPVRSVQPMQPSFQNQISSMSSQWTTYCPAFFTTEEMLCFDRNSHQWRSLFPLLFLSGPFDFSRIQDYCDITMAGPLVCFNDCMFQRRGHTSTWSVTNVITKCSRKLPDLLREDEEVTHIRLLLVGPNLYKVLLVYLSIGETHVFNSSLQTWTVKRFEGHEGMLFSSSAYLDKKLYCLLIDNGMDSLLTLWTYQVEQEAWLMPTPYQSFVRRVVRDCAALVCEDKVMVAIWFLETDEPSDIDNVFRRIQIFELDVGTSKLTQVSRGPPRDVSNLVFHMQYVTHMHYASDANFLYFFGMLRDYTAPEDDADFQVITYHVQSKAWGYLPETPPHDRPYDAPFVGQFQPGLNPFISV